MITVNAAFGQEQKSLGTLGRVGENETRQIVFDCSDILAEYPGAEIVCVFRRACDRDAYIAKSSMIDKTLTVAVTDADVAVPGTLQIELRAIIGQAVRKSATYTAQVDDSLRGLARKPGNPAADLLNHLEKTLERAENSVSAADQAAKEANDAAESANDITKAVQIKLDNGELKGEKGEKGDKGDQGDVQDVQVAGVSVLNNGVANVPVASETTYGTIKAGAPLDTYLLVENGVPKVSYYLALLAKEKKQQVLSDVSKVAEIVHSCKSADELAQYFAIGDQIVVPWKDMDDTAHNTDETAYQVSFAVADYQMVTMEDERNAPGLMLQMEQSAPYAVCFSSARAAYYCEETLAPGTYDITLSEKYGGIAAGTTLEFTTVQSVPEGGVIFLGSDKGLSTYAADRVTRIESTTATATTAPTGTSLGTTGQGGMNTIARMTGGHNRWSTSALRQWLNGTGAGWWHAQTAFDMAPTQINKKGFMAGFRDDFLSAIRPIKISTLLNAYDATDDLALDNTYDTFFPPALQQVCGQFYNYGEGNVLMYWDKRLDNPTNYLEWYVKYPGYVVPSLADGNSKETYLRSAIYGGENRIAILDPKGFISDSQARGSRYPAPLCVIC
jgi:hypothetical protein